MESVPNQALLYSARSALASLRPDAPDHVFRETKAMVLQAIDGVIAERNSDGFRERRRTPSASEKLTLMVRLAENFRDPIATPEKFFQDLLAACLSIIVEADAGIAGLDEGKGISLMAAQGCDYHRLQNISLKFADDFEEAEVALYSSADGNPPPFKQKGIRALAEAGIMIRAWLVITFPAYKKQRAVLILHQDADNPYSFRKESVDLFEALAVLASAYLRMRYRSRELIRNNTQLRQSNTRLEASYKEIETLWDKLRKMIDLSLEMGNDYSGIEVFYRQLLTTALMIIDEADYASISLVDDQRWTYLACIGHDLAALRALDLRPEWCRRSKEILVVDDILKKHHQDMPEEISKSFGKATKKSSSTMMVSLDVGQRYVLNLSLDIAGGKKGKFRKSSRKVFKAFANLAQAFLRIRLANDTIRKSYRQFTSRLAVVAEAHDGETWLHNLRVGEIARYLAAQLGLSKELVGEIHSFAPLHDIGKIFIENELLSKKGSLETTEYERVKMHTLLAGHLLDVPYFAVARNIATYHHERYDGSGYPSGASGDDIPLEAQIAGLADVYDALRSKRSYKEAQTHEETIRQMKAESGKGKAKRYNPAILALLEDAEPELDHLYRDGVRLDSSPFSDPDFHRAMLTFAGLKREPF